MTYSSSARKIQNDTRCFPSSRVRGLSDWDSLPVVHDGLDFFIPPQSLANLRHIAIGNRRWEIWSPNSSTIAYYPGLPPSNYTWRSDSDPSQRRIDGSLGRFDYTLCPQHYVASKPWLPFIATPPSIADVTLFPETVQPNQVWESDQAPSLYTGHIESQYIAVLQARIENLNTDIAREDLNDIPPEIWANRPAFPADASQVARDLRLVKTYDEAVDLIATISCQVKGKAAWLAWLRHYRQEDAKSPQQYRKLPVPRANEEFMGVWLNGIPEDIGLWLMMSARVPCFIVHEFAPDENVKVNAPALKSFVLHTNIAIFDDPNSYVPELIAQRNGTTPSSFRARQYTSEDLPRPSKDSHHRSSRAAHRQHAEEKDRQRRHRLIPSVSSALEHMLGPENFQEDISWGGVASDRVPWPIPPSLARLRSKQNSDVEWESWKADVDMEGMMSFIYSSTDHSEDDKLFTYFNRENHRFLHFHEQYIAPPGLVADPAIFGMPVPRMPFYRRNTYDSNTHSSSSEEENLIPEGKVSTWMYIDRQPLFGHKMVQLKEPVADDLPFLCHPRHSNSAAGEFDLAPYVACAQSVFL